MKETIMSETIREFLIQGSEKSPYKVVFLKSGNNIQADCTCRAGIVGMLCKHRLSILDGDNRAVVSDNTDEVAEVASWLAGSPVGEAIAEVVALEAQKKSIESRIKTAKKMVSKALIPGRGLS